MEFELPKINVSFEYDEEKDEIVFVINGVEKRVKTEDMITGMEKLQEQNTALEQEPCDCISRQAVLNLMADYDLSMGQVVKGIHALPPVTPKPKTGHWIISPNDCFMSCSECGLHGDKGIYKHYRWCPNCGAKMESEVPT